MLDHRTTTPIEERRMPASDAGSIGLYDILLFLKRSWKPLVATTAIGAGIGLGATMMEVEKFEASANIQIATMANEAIEAPAVLAEKLKLPRYYSDELINLCGLSGSKRPGVDLAKALKPAVNRSAPMVSLRFESTSAKAAEECLTAVMLHVRADQDALASSAVSARTAELKALRSRLAELEKLKAGLDARMSAFLSNESKAEASESVLNALSSTNFAIQQLITDIGKVELALSSTQTRRVGLAAPIYVESTHSLRKQAMLVAVSAGAGFVAGVLLLLAAASMRHDRERRLASHSS
ncbi:MAG TPA: hypothetical protein VIM12_17470 [Noviherbaspirillum sp.]|uniref:hypothetical protein n=1 Tax=Noviherbaspirillum sp. TaxID=1926288 RepID=UPI002F9200D1